MFFALFYVYFGSFGSIQILFFLLHLLLDCTTSYGTPCILVTQRINLKNYCSRKWFKFCLLKSLQNMHKYSQNIHLSSMFEQANKI